MKDNELKKAVQERYGKAALQVKSGSASCCDPSQLDLYSPDETGGASSKGREGVPGLRESHRADRPPSRGDGARSRLRRRHRRAPLRPARRTPGKAYGLDMTDEMLAPGPGEPAQGRPRQRRSSSRARSRTSPSGPFRGRDDLQLRDQPLRGQGPRAARGLPRPAPGRPLRRLGHRRRGPVPEEIRRDMELVDRMRRGRARGDASTGASSRRRDSSTSASRQPGATASRGRRRAKTASSAPSSGPSSPSRDYFPMQ